MKILPRITRKLAKKLDISGIDTSTQDIVTAVIALANKNENLEELSRLTNALHYHTLGGNAYEDIGSILYSLDEYVDLLYAKLEGKKINEKYLEVLRQDLLKGHL